MAQDFTLSDFLPYLLNQAAEAASQDFASIYKAQYGLQRTDWRVLAHLGEFGGLSARDISHRTGENKTRISRSVARLQTLEILERTTNKDDRRLETLILSEKGQKVYTVLSDLARKHDAALSKALGLNDVTTLKEILLNISKLDQS